MASKINISYMFNVGGSYFAHCSPKVWHTDILTIDSKLGVKILKMCPCGL